MAATSPIERLPVELKLQLLPFLTDVQSLRSTILTCPSLYNAFMQYESLITTRVLRRQMPHEVLPEAIAAWKSSRVQPANREIVHDFVEEHFRVRRSRPKPLSLFEAIGVVKLHSCVEHFTDDFATLMFEESSRFSQIGSPPAWPLSRHEVMRIQRALYRFEVYGNLFRDGELFKWQEQRDLFFSKFSYWENEQLGCVRDYLYRIACPAFNDVAEHDVEWGAMSVESVILVNFHGDFGNGCIEYLLSLGLASLHEIVYAESYEARYRTVYRRSPGIVDKSLYENLMDANSYGDMVCVSNYTQALHERLARTDPPFVQDPDSGPGDAWRWVPTEDPEQNFVYSFFQSALHARGYGMWDRTRMDAWDLFQERFGSRSSPGWDLMYESIARKAAMQMSFERRKQIYQLGGRGWWDACDESKIVWGDGNEPRDLPLILAEKKRPRIWMSQRSS